MTATNKTAVRGGEPAADRVLSERKPVPRAPVDRVTDGDERPSRDRLIVRFINNLRAALAAWNT
jgi:hypothetical protein